jgi:prepilin peptidase CpaA
MFPMLLAFAASSDLLTMTISNRVSLILAAGFFALAAATGMSTHEIGLHALAALTVLAAGFVCFSLGWIGGGDAKLAAATVLWLGFEHLFEYLLWASVFGGVLSLMLLKFRNLPLPPLAHRLDWLVRLHDKNAGVPYGIALAIAALLIYPYTAWMQSNGL